MGRTRCIYPWKCTYLNRSELLRISACEWEFQSSPQDNINGSVRLLCYPSSFPYILIVVTRRMISVVGFLDSIVAAKQNSARFGYSISPNRELVALGAANLGASFVPGILPAYGSITRWVVIILWWTLRGAELWGGRSRINGDVGGRTQMASLICSALILLATFFLLPYLYYLPRCVLASM